MNCPKCNGTDTEYSDDYLVNGEYAVKLFCRDCDDMYKKPLVHNRWCARENGIWIPLDWSEKDEKEMKEFIESFERDAKRVEEMVE